MLINLLDVATARKWHMLDLKGWFLTCAVAEIGEHVQTLHNQHYYVSMRHLENEFMSHWIEAVSELCFVVAAGILSVNIFTKTAMP